jgi:hypothetical protein
MEGTAMRMLHVTMQAHQSLRWSEPVHIISVIGTLVSISTKPGTRRRDLERVEIAHHNLTVRSNYCTRSTRIHVMLG